MFNWKGLYPPLIYLDNSEFYFKPVTPKPFERIEVYKYKDTFYTIWPGFKSILSMAKRRNPKLDIQTTYLYVSIGYILNITADKPLQPARGLVTLLSTTLPIQEFNLTDTPWMHIQVHPVGLEVKTTYKTLPGTSKEWGNTINSVLSYKVQTLAPYLSYQPITDIQTQFKLNEIDTALHPPTIPLSSRML